MEVDQKTSISKKGRALARPTPRARRRMATTLAGTLPTTRPSSASTAPPHSGRSTRTSSSQHPLAVSRRRAGSRRYSTVFWVACVLIVRTTESQSAAGVRVLWSRGAPASWCVLRAAACGEGSSSSCVVAGWQRSYSCSPTSLSLTLVRLVPQPVCIEDPQVLYLAASASALCRLSSRLSTAPYSCVFGVAH